MNQNNELKSSTSLLSLDDDSPNVAEGAWVAPGAKVIGRVTLGEKTSVWYNCVIRGDVENIIIGDRTNIQDLTVIHADKGEPTIIGNDVTVGHAAIVHGCKVGDRCLIGMGSRILNNAVIGEESLVAAGALVPPGKVYPPRSLIMGSPAKVVRQISDAEVEGFLASAEHYANNARRHRDGIAPASQSSTTTPTTPK